MQHPVTNEYEESRKHIAETLEAIDRLEGLLFGLAQCDAGSDGTSKGIRSYREKNKVNHIHFFKNMEPTDFLRLLANAKCLIGNSSVGLENVRISVCRSLISGQDKTVETEETIRTWV